MHEIITLQLGQASNYIATHFWNTQESYFTYSQDQDSLVDHDIHFRPGVGANGSETFTPRTLIYDLKGGFGSLRKINALYELEEPGSSQAVWNGAPVIQRQTAILQHPYQQSLEEGSDPPPLSADSVRYWSDFNRVYFHPRSIVQLNEYELGSALLPFENWSSGEELFNSLDKEHDLLDRDLRYFAEEADQMQGIQMMAGIDDAWGGFAARYMDRIRDEYGKTTVWFWGVEQGIKGASREKRFLRLTNTAKSISEISTQASLFMPLAIPNNLPNYVTLNPASQWHVSGLLATAVESMTLPSRLKLGSWERETLDQLSVVLNVNGNQNIARLRMSAEQKFVPALNGHDRQGRTGDRDHSRDPRIPSSSRNRTLDEDGSEDQADVTPLDIECFLGANSDQSRGRRRIKNIHVFGQAETYRGSETDIAKLKDERFHDVDGQQQARRRAAGLPLFHRTTIPLPYPVLDSFPHIFASGPSTSLRINTSLSTDTSVAVWIKDLQSIVSRAVGIDEREALSNALGVIAESYEEGWDSGSDEDDD